MIRIATVTATNKKYIVQRMEFPSSGPAKVHCWGELVYMKGLRTKHEDSKCFLASAVTVADVEKTVALERELFDQAVAAKRDAGFRITTSKSGKTVTYER